MQHNSRALPKVVADHTLPHLEITTSKLTANNRPVFNRMVGNSTALHTPNHTHRTIDKTPTQLGLHNMMGKATDSSRLEVIPGITSTSTALGKAMS